MSKAIQIAAAIVWGVEGGRPSWDRVAIYARVSTSDQSTDSQLLDLRRYVRERGWELFKEFCGSRFLSRWGVDLIPLGATNYNIYFQPLRRLQRIRKLTLKDRRVRAILRADKGVSGWVREGKKARPRLKSRRRLSEGLGEVIGGGMAGSRIFFKTLLKSTAPNSSA